MSERFESRRDNFPPKKGGKMSSQASRREQGMRRRMGWTVEYSHTLAEEIERVGL